MMANMDIQFVSDIHAVVTYVTDYFSKDDEQLTKVMKEALKEKADCNDFERLNYLKKTFFTHRQVNVAQATYGLIPGMDLKGSNVGTVFVASGFPDNRHKRLYRVDKGSDKEDHEIEATADEESNVNVSPTETFCLEDRVGKYAIATTIHEKYSMRPKKLSDICLAQFATSYENCTLPKGIQFQDSISTVCGTMTLFGEDTQLPKYILLSNEEATPMKLRNMPLVLRIHKSNKKKDYEELYAEMLLFLPWREESELFWNDGGERIKLFNKSRNTISSNRKSIFPYSDTMQELSICLETAENYRPSHVGDNLSAAAEQENLDDLETMEPVDTSKLPDEIVESTHSEKRFIKPIEVDSDANMLNMARSLGHEQMVVFGRMIDHAKKIKVSRHTKIMVDLNPPRIIAHGKFKRNLKREYYLYIFQL